MSALINRISVIVPTKNSAAVLDVCLRSVRRQDHSHVELIVVDNGSNDATCEIAEKYADKVLQRGPERSAQRNFGVLNSTGKYVVIIDSDMELTSDVLSQCVSRLEQNPGEVGLVIPEDSVGEGFWANCKKLERSFYVGIPWMEAARCFRRSSFDEFHGYDENNTGTEDYDLPQRIVNQYGSNVIGRVGAKIIHHEGRIKLLYSCKKKFYYARRLDVYKGKKENRGYFALQSNPVRRYILFFSKPRVLIRQPLTSVGMLFMKAMEFISGAMGYLLRKRNSSIERDIYKR